MKNQHNNRYSWRRWLFIAFPLLAVAIFFAVRVQAQADTIYNQTVPVSFTATNCNGENVALSGNEHDTFHETFDGSGGVYVDFHANLQDVTGVGDQGNTYHAPDALHNQYNIKVGYEQTVTVSQLFVSQGSAPNFVLKFDVHITVNPDGTVTSFHDNFSTECRG
jgi:hypothetical protein